MNIDRLQILVSLGLLLLLASCKTFAPKEYLIPQSKLVITLQNKFPIKHEAANGTVRLTVDSPQLALQPEQNRISITGQYVANVTLFELKGTFTFSSGLRYHPAQRAIYMSEARFDSFSLSGNLIEEKVRALINQEVSEFAATHPLYAFREDELVALGARLEVSAIQVEKEGVLLKLHKVK